MDTNINLQARLDALRQQIEKASNMNDENTEHGHGDAVAFRLVMALRQSADLIERQQAHIEALEARLLKVEYMTGHAVPPPLKEIWNLSVETVETQE